MTQTALRHVLVVDDNEEDRAELRSQLLRGSAQRWQFTEAGSGTAALQILNEAGPTRFTCVLLDYYLHDMDAQEVLAQLCRPPVRPPCPVLVVTGSSELDGPRLMRAGAQDYISKSWITPQSLARAVDNAVERFALQQEAVVGQQALQAERHRLALALTAGQMGMFEVDLEDGTLYWSNEVFALFGVTPETFVPTRAGFRTLVHPEDRNIPWQALHQPARRAWLAELGSIEPQVLRGAPALPATVEFRILRPDGQCRWMSQRGQTGLDAQGRMRHVGIVFDVTERKRADEQKAFCRQQLHDHQFYTRSLIDSNLDAMVVTDTAGIVTDANTQMEKWSGFSRGELEGCTFSSLFTDPARAQACLQLAQGQLSLHDHELDMLTRDGSTIVLSLNASTFRDRRHNPRGVIFSLRDVTQRHFLERALQETNALLEESRWRAVKERDHASDLLLHCQQDLLPQLQAVMDNAVRLAAEPLPSAAAQETLAPQLLHDCSKLVAMIQSALVAAAPVSANRAVNRLT